MNTSHLLKAIHMTDGLIYGIVGLDRRVLASCEPEVRIYRDDIGTPILGRASNALKGYHVAIVICGQPELKPHINWETLRKVSAYSITAYAPLEDGEAKKVNFDGLTPDIIDPLGEWKFTTENLQFISELLKLETLN